MMKVKPLEWIEDWGGNHEDIPEWRAKTPWGSITVSIAGHRDDDGKRYDRHATVPNGLRISLLAAAQADHDARVLSAIEDTSS